MNPHVTSLLMVALLSTEAPGRGQPSARVRGALLVAPSDPEAPSYPVGPTGFAPMPGHRRGFPTIVVAGREVAPTFSPDGSQIAFAWTGDEQGKEDQFDLYVKAIGSEKPLRSFPLVGARNRRPSRLRAADWFSGPADRGETRSG